jgi:hypothetical protein
MGRMDLELFSSLENVRLLEDESNVYRYHLSLSLSLSLSRGDSSATEWTARCLERKDLLLLKCWCPCSSGVPSTEEYVFRNVPWKTRETQWLGFMSPLLRSLSEVFFSFVSKDRIKIACIVLQHERERERESFLKWLSFQEGCHETNPLLSKTVKFLFLLEV